MKNLVTRAVSSSHNVSNCDPLREGQHVTAFCASPAGDGLLYCATNAGHVICLSAGGSKVEWQAALLPAADGAATSNCIAGLEYVLELDAVMVALSSGDLLLVYTETKELEEVGSISGGVQCMAWSPDGELLAIISATGNLLLMTKDWEALAEVGLWQPPNGSTTGAAAAAGAAADTQPPPLLRAHISWRGDGKYLATSCSYAGDTQQQVVVWDREGAATHSRCSGEEAQSLTGAICWPPNSRHLYAAAAAPGGAATSSSEGPTEAAAGLQQAPQQQQGGPRVQLFERNGLPHGSFHIQPSNSSSSGSDAYRVAQLTFSPDSEVLAVVLAPVAGGIAAGQPQFDHSSDSWLVQLWHRSNWHWYQKQQLVVAAPGPAGLLVCWGEGQGLLLHLMSSRGEYQSLTFDWQACVSGRGTAAAVDGQKLLLTPLRLGLVPPPMAAVTAVLPHPVNHLAWWDGDISADLDAGPSAQPAPSSSSNGAEGTAGGASPAEVLAALTSDGHLHFLRAVESDLWEETLEEEAECGVEGGVVLPLGAVASVGQSNVAGDCQPPLADGRAIKGVAWLGPQQLLLVAAPFPDPADEASPGDVVIEVSVDFPPGPNTGSSLLSCLTPVVTQTSCSYSPGTVLLAVAAPQGGALVQLADGSLWRYSPGCGVLHPLPSSSSFPCACPSVLPLPAAALQSGDALALGLARAGVLWWGSHKLAWDVTSAAVRGGGPGGPALLYVTRQHLMFTVLLSELRTYKHQLPDAAAGALTWKRSEYPGDLRAAMSVAMRPDALTAAARDVHLRAVEQGAAVLAAPWGTPQVVLQMQRGNLEGVAPRLLVLVAILVALDAGDYLGAWRLATSNRVDLNIIVDYKWPRFVEQAGQFVQAVPRQADLCDLLFALKPGSVLAPEGLYSSLVAALNLPTDSRQQHGTTAAPAEGAAAGGASSSPDSKVGCVCAAVREAVQQLPSSAEGTYLKVVVTSFARSQPADLEAALLAIRDLKEGSSSSNSSSSPPPAAAAAAGPGPSSSASAAADAALKHLLLYVDTDELYKVALGLYDLSLAFMVVSQAQKDPGEYLAELSAFNEVDENLRKAHVDRHLGRFDKAVRHLVAAGPQQFEAALKLAEQHGLLRQLLHLLQQQQQQQQDGAEAVPLQQRIQRTLQAYGQALLGQRRAEDAAVAFMCAGDLAAAVAAYKECGQWRMAMSLAGRLGWPAKQQQQLAVDLVESLSSSGQGADAAQLLLGVLGDVDGGVAALVAARAWREALQVSYQYGREDLVETVVVPAAAQGAASLLTEAREAQQSISKYLTRLREVRAKRQAMAAAVAAAEAEAAALGLEGGGLQLEDDMVSEAPSVVSGLSVYTDRTAATTATGAGSSTRAPSTVGGKKAMRSERKAAKRGKIRQGSPAEEGALVGHLQGLGPAGHVLEEAGQLAELLCLQAHFEDAQRLQQGVAEWQQAHLAALQDIQQNPLPADVAAAAAVGAGAGRPGASSSNAAGATAAAAAAAASEVRWKWEVLRAA